MADLSSSIVLQDVHKIYHIEAQKVEALRGVSLTLKKGQMVAVTGKSGAGKSTFLHVLGTLDRPTHGKIFLNGTDVSSMNDHLASTFRNSTIGFVFQGHNLLSEFSALENIMLPGLIAGHPQDLVEQRAHDMLKAVQLTHRSRHRPGELSGGEQQRIAIARALSMEPPIVLADEPTGNLDQKTSQIIQELLLSLCHDRQMTMVLVTHDRELAVKLPYQIVMEDGRIIENGAQN
ncbi:MAG: ABC transporter ATP-binding protein [Oligoflexales bacterium]